jgi:hypothetical protein
MVNLKNGFLKLISYKNINKNKFNFKNGKKKLNKFKLLRKVLKKYN